MPASGDSTDVAGATEGERARRPLPERLLSWPLLAALAAAPPAAAWLAGRSPAWRDTASLYGPVRGLVTEALRAGRLPLWNPYEGTGQPLLADAIHGVLHPLSLLAAALDPGGVDLLVALYLVAAALGAFALARELGLARRHAFVAGAAFGLSGFVASMTSNLVFLAGAGSMPWQVAALAAAGRGARLGVPAAAAATAGTLLSGDAQMAVVAAALGAALAAERAGLRGAARAAGGTALGLLVAAVQLLPTLEAMGASPRAAGLEELERTLFALSPWRLVELAVPGLFVRLDGPPDPAVFQWLGGPAPPGYELPFAPSVHLGIPALALAAAAPLRLRRVRLLAGALAASLWLALGHRAGARQALEAIPLWGQFRYAEKLVAPLTLTLALLAAFGAAAAAGGTEARRRVARAALAGAALGLLALAVAWAAEGPPRARALLVEALAAGLPHALGGAAAVAAAVLLPRTEGWRAALPAGAVAAALLAAIPSTRVLMPREPCAAWPGALPGGVPGPRLVVPYFRPAVADAAGGVEPATAREAFVLDECLAGRAGQVSHNVRDRVDAFWSYGALGSDRLLRLVRALDRDGPRAVRAFSVTHASVLRPADEGEEALYRAATGGGTLVARSARFPLELHAVPHLPWARLAPAARAVPDLAAAAAAFREVAGSGRDVVVVESAGPVPVTRGSARPLSRDPERLAIEVEAEGEGLLVVNDAFWPGWVARVDGVEAPILAANVIARGVVVPAGRHLVTMTYAPPALRWGAALTLAGVAGCLALAARGVRRRAPVERRP